MKNCYSWFKKSSALMSMIFISYLGFGQLSGTKTIGGTSPDYTSITAAVSALNSSGVNGAVTFNIRSGTYTGQVTLRSVFGASATNTIRFRPDPANTTPVIIQNNSTSWTSNWVIGFDGASYISFDSCEVKSLSATYSRVVEFKGTCSNISMTGNKLICGDPNPTTSTYDAIVYDNTGTSNFASDITFDNNEFVGGAYGIYAYGNRTSSLQGKWTVTNNTFKDWNYTGVFAYYHNDFVLDGNHIENKPGYSSPRGFYGYYSYNLSANNNTVIIHGGTSSPMGMYIYRCGAYLNSTREGITNNMISRTGTGGCCPRGLYIFDPDYRDIDHNSISWYSTSTSSSYSALYVSSGTSVRVRNNSAANMGAGYGYYQGSTAYTNSNNNAYSGSGVSFRHSNRTQALNVNPQYNSTSDLHTYSTALFKAGTPLTTVTTDIDGETRNTTTPCIGADEYVLYNNDAGVSSFVNSALCSGSQSIQVNVRNYGTVAMTSYKVDWSVAVNGGTPVSQTQLVVTGANVASGATAVATLGNYTLASGSSYDFKVWTSDPNGGVDSAGTNDTLEITIAPALSGIYTVGSLSTNDYSTIDSAVMDIMAKGICGPVELHLEDETFTEQVTIGAIPGGSATNTLTIKSNPANANMALWQFDPTSTATNYVVNFSGASYVNIDSVKLKASNTTRNYGRVIYFSGASDHIAFHGDSIIGRDGATTSTWDALLYEERSPKVDDITIMGCDFVGGAYSVYGYGPTTSGTGRSGNWVVKDNEMLDWGYYGMYMYGHYNDTIHNNNMISADEYRFMRGFYGYYFLGDVSYNTIVMHGYGYSFETSWTSGATTTNRGRISNNMISITEDTYTGTVYGLYVSRSNYWDIYYNSVYVATPNGNARGMYLISATGANVRNNSVYCEGGYGCQRSGSVTSMDYNNWYAPNGQNTSGFTQGANSINVDPLYKSDDDLHASSALMYREGTPIAGITDDRDGKVRNATTPTMGADEYFVPDYDAGVTAFAGGALCTGSQAVEVEVSNLGYLDMTSFNVHWSWAVNGGTPTAGTTLNVSSSSIGKGADTVVTLGNITLNSGSTYTIVAYTTSPSGQTDQRMSNDTLTFDLRPAMTGTYTIATNGDYTSFSDAVQDLDDLGVCGPVEFHVSDSTYAESVTLEDIVGVSGTNTITFRSNPSNTNMAVLEGNQVFGDISHVRFTDMHLKSLSGYTIYLEGENDSLTFDSCKIEAFGTSSSNAGIWDERGVNTSNLFIRDNEIWGGYYGVYLYGGGSSRTQRDENIWIERNDFHDIQLYYVYSYYQAGNHYNENNIESKTSGSQYAFFGRYNNDMEWSRNKINMRSNGFQYGIYDYYANYYNKRTTDTTKIINNFISFSNDLATSTQYGIYGYYQQNFFVQHNNVRTNTSGTSYGYYEYNPSYTNVSNNIFAAERGNRNTSFRGNSTWGPTVRNNTRKNNGYWTGTAGTWGTNGFTRDASAINANPRYKIPGNADLRVNAIEYDSAAFNVGVTVDYFGAPRNVPFHDVGAHEFDPCYFDGAMIDVSSIYTSVPTGQSVYVFGKAGNRGLDTITGTRVNALVAGVSSNSLIDTLTPDQDSTVAVLAPVGTTAGQIAAQMFTTINEADCDSTNDTLNYIINVSDSIYAMDDSTYDNRLGFGTGFTGEFGNVFELFQPDVLTTGSFFLNGPIRGASVKLKLYAVNDTATPAVQQVIDSTRAFQVGVNGTGWYTLEFGCGGVSLQPGKYLIAIQQINPVRMELAINTAFLPGRPGTRYERGTGSTWNDLYNSSSQVVANSTLLLRANFGEISDKEVLEDTTLLCFGSSAQIKPNKEYQFQTWSTGEFFDSIKVSQPGMITVRVEDEIGCEYFDTTQVVAAPQIAVSDMVTRATCDSSDGMAVAMATGAYGPYTYHWSNGYVGDTLMGVPGDVYTVTAVDSIGCEQDLDVEILGATPVVSSTTTYPTCNGDNDGSASLSVDKGIPGYSYAWSSGGTNATEGNLSGGNYTVTVTDKSNCPNVMSVTVMDPPAINVLMKNNAPSACKLADGSAEAAVTGGIAPFKYFWSNAQTTGKAVGLTEGVYDVTITDSLGCVKTGKVKVVDPNSPVSVPNNLSLDCSYDTATAEVTVNGGTAPFKYSWNTGSSATKLNGVTAGSYQLRVEDAAGCDHDTTVVITAPTKVTIGFINLVDNGENNVEATANATGGTPPYSSYTWSNGETDSTAKNLPNGVNTVTVVDANGCSFEAQIDVYSEYTGIGLLAREDAMRIFPNPTTGIINIEFNLTSEEDVTVRVMNAVGEVIEVTEQTNVSNDNMQVDITGFASGVYFIETSIGAEKVVSRIQLSK